MASIKLALPVNGPISSGFGYRKAPNKLASTYHKGIDISVPVGTQVKTPLSGKAFILPPTVKGGNILLIKHDNNITTKYFHLSGFNVVDGQSVNQYDVVAFTGNTGNVTGPHLHWEVLVNGVKVDPLKYIDTSVVNNDAGKNDTLHGQEAQNSIVNKKEYTDFITVDSKYIDTLNKFIAKHDLLLTDAELFNFKDNKSRIEKAYTKEQIQTNGGANKDVLNVGTVIEVPLNKIKNNNPYKVNQTLTTNKNYKAFIEYEIKKLFYHPDYIKLNTVTDYNNRLVSSVFKGNIQVSVWLWSKALSLDGGFLIDISAFVKKAITNVDKEGGNFTLNLPHLTYKRVNDGKDIDIDINYYNQQHWQGFVVKNSTHAISSENNSTTQQTVNYYKRKNSFFNDFINENDIIFIRFEPLKMDSDSYNRDGDLIKINPSELPGKVFDMIGLVDSVNISVDGKSNSVQLNVSGRDLMKLVIDDGVYFFPIQYAVKNGEQIIKNSSKSRAAKRLMLPDNSINNNQNLNFIQDTGIVPDVRFNFDMVQTVEDWLLFIFSQLVNIDICPDNLLKFYEEKTFVVSQSDSLDSQGAYGYKRTLANGLWQIVKLVVDGEISNRKIADASLATDTGSLLNLIRKVCQNPFVDFDGDTFGDKYYFKVRKPPFSEQSYKSNFTIDIFEDDVYSDSLQYNNEVYTFYRLTAMGSLLDASDGANMILIPAVFLPEYAEIWGNKVLDIQTNFLDWDPSVTNESDLKLQLVIEQGKQDLDWLIETNCYSPFSRIGNIVIKGDRRIKRGINIRYMPTGELFYVEGVNNVNILDETTQRTTTLSVSHGIVEKYYDKYFKIVNLLRNAPTDSSNRNLSSQTWTVNKDIFEFFITRKQW